MKTVYIKEHLSELKEYPKEIIKSILKTINILEDNYGEVRNMKYDLGGYVTIVEDIREIEIIKRENLKGLVPEYTDIIKCSEGVNWTSSLFLLSSDFAIVVVCTEELSKFLLE